MFFLTCFEDAQNFISNAREAGVMDQEAGMVLITELVNKTHTTNFKRERVLGAYKRFLDDVCFARIEFLIATAMEEFMRESIIWGEGCGADEIKESMKNIVKEVQRKIKTEVRPRPSKKKEAKSDF